MLLIVTHNHIKLLYIVITQYYIDTIYDNSLIRIISPKMGLFKTKNIYF